MKLLLALSIGVVIGLFLIGILSISIELSVFQKMFIGGMCGYIGLYLSRVIFKFLNSESASSDQG